jgi:formylglycine-generating enzyme required for sulfatase activity
MTGRMTGEAPPSPSPKRLSTRLRLGTAVAVVLSLAVFVVGQACQIVGGYKSFEPGDGPPSHPCDVLPVTTKPDPKGATLVLAKVGGGGCYWIHRTEVTVEQYDQFLAADAQPSALWDQKLCAWKTAPSDPVHEMNQKCTEDSMNAEADPFRATKPIRCVDWCDAQAYCKWLGMGMDLCGGVTNGTFVGPSDVPDQWGGACSPDTLSYPYLSGASPVLGECNVGLGEDGGQCYSYIQQTQCAPTDVGSHAFEACTAPCGAVDLIGNVAEWVGLCGDSDGAPTTRCQHRGGSFADDLDSTNATCYVPATDPISTRDRGLGLRCCVGLSDAEKALLR